MSISHSDPQLRALIYNRVSSDPSGRGISVASQDAENRSFCAQHGWEVAATITDNDRSASRFAVKERKGYREVRDALAGSSRGRIDVLVCWESSRANRDLADYVELRDLCAQYKVKLAYKGRIYDMDQGDDRFATGLDALVAEREAEQIRERVLRGHRASAAKGRPRGTVPYGYAREYDRHTGYLNRQVPDAETAPVVREITRRILAGESLHSIAADLNLRGVLSPQAWKDRTAEVEVERGGWTSSKIRRMFESQSIIGVRTHHGVPHPEPTWEALIRPADYRKVKALLADPSRLAHSRGLAERHLLSGIATCSRCGAWCRAGRNRGVMSYICAGNGPGTGKGHVTRAQWPVDELVRDTVVALVERDDIGVLLAAGGQQNEESATAAQEAADLRARLGLFYASAAQPDGISPAALAEIEAQLRPQIEAAERRALTVPTPAVIEDLAGPGALQRWEDELTVPRRRQIVRALMRVVVHPAGGRHGAHGFDPSKVEMIWRF